MSALVFLGISGNSWASDAAAEAVAQEFPLKIRPNSTLSEALRPEGVDPSEVAEMAQAAKPVQHFGRLPAGLRFKVLREPGPITAFSGVMFRFSPLRFVEVRRGAGARWEAREIQKRSLVRLVTYSGVVKSSLWESATEAQMDPSLISELSEVFAWQVDFAREVRVDDRWRLTVEQRFTEEGDPVGWGRIIAAEYENDGTVHSAALFREDGQELGYFAPDGTSLRRMFLKSPIKFGRISSRFNRKRFHPILKERRPHLGVDYAAPVGTPIRAVGDGTVTLAGWRGGGGNTIQIRHNSVYRTSYLHMSRFAAGIHSGSKVRQGQVIGYVGSTGLSNGPHVHFEFYESGRFVDPLGKRFPSADPVPRAKLAVFRSQAESALGTLPPWFQPGVSAPGPVYVAAQEPDAQRSPASRN